MQTFKNTVDQTVWQFEADVVATSTNGVYAFTDAQGNALSNIPKTLQPYTIPAPTAAALLAQAQRAQSAVINKAAAQAITGGVASSSLGSLYTYPTQPTDQANLNANVVSSLLPNLPATWTTPQMCCDAKGNWGYVLHTTAQIQQVGSDVKNAIAAVLVKNNTLQKSIASATTPAAAQAIVW